MDYLDFIYAGSDELSLKVFQWLLTEGCHPKAILCGVDKPRGRHLQVRPLPLVEEAKKNDIPVLQPVSLKNPEVQEQILGFQAPILVVVSFGRLIPDSLLAKFPLGAINLHPSLLPKYRGAAPVQRALMNGETQTGVTLFRLTREMDAGPILAQCAFPIASEDTAGDVMEKVFREGAPLLLRLLHQLAEEGKIEGTPQDESQATYAPKLRPEEARIHWDRKAEDIHNHIRALNPRPGAFTFFRTQRIKIWKTRVIANDTVSRPGEILPPRQTLTVGTGRGILEILEIQTEGKRRMKGREWLLGARLSSGEAFES